jgi:hypothetical protein
VLGDFICAMASGLMDLNEGEEIKAIYNKYSPVDFDEGEQEFTNGMREAMQDIFGLDLGEDAELKSPEELIDHLHEHMAKEHQAGLEAEQEKRSRRKKTAKQIAREEAAKAESEQTSLSIREVYRKLASALHPDREQDPQERLRKTALMQRVNQAYEKKNLLVLLELQLELEHIDAQAISGLSEQRLKHFNKILKEQLAELEQEIQYFEAPILAQFQLPGYIRIHSSQVLAMLDAEIAKFKQEIRKSERELLVPNDLPAFKKWIKARQREAKAFERNLSDRNGDFPFFD